MASSKVKRPLIKVTFYTLTLSSLIMISRCASIERNSHEKEQLLAVPVEEQPVFTKLRENDHPSYTTQALHYIDPRQHPQVETSQPDVVQSENLIRGQDGVYYLLRPTITNDQPTMVGMTNEASPNNNEQLTVLSVAQDPNHGPQIDSNAREYSGEIIYVGQDMDPRNALVEAQNGQLRVEQQSALSNIASLVPQDSSLPATILTEVPVKDLPEHVLERLKKDYGVKVVATREKPGANLVINCEDYTDQDSTICSRRSMYINEYSKTAPYTFDATLAEENNSPKLSNGQLRSVADKRLTSEEKKASEDQNHILDQALNQDFGSRQSAYVNAEANNQPQPESENINGNPSQTEKEDSFREDTEHHHHLGFDEQPSRKAA